MTSFEDYRERIATAFCWEFKNSYHNPRMAKYEVLFEMAQEAKGGCLVEYGVWWGGGAIALALGTQNCTVYAIDDYEAKSGWIGEPYEPEDEAIFHRNIKNFGVDVRLIKEKGLEANKAWKQPVALFHWDLGVRNQMRDDFHAWHGFIMPGGLFLLHDTADGQMGSKETIALAQSHGYALEEYRPGSYLQPLRRPL